MVSHQKTAPILAYRVSHGRVCVWESPSSTASEWPGLACEPIRVGSTTHALLFRGKGCAIAAIRLRSHDCLPGAPEGFVMCYKCTVQPQ